jgi:hypothetical protein
MGRDLEVVKRSCRDEPMWVVIYMCMEALLWISMYSYFYVKLAKPCFSYYLLGFSLQQNQRTRGWNRFCLEAGSRGGCQSQQWDLACVNWHLALWESSKELGQKSQSRPCQCELVSGLMRKPDIQKNSIQGSQIALCPPDVNKKVMLITCFSCFSVPILKET